MPREVARMHGSDAATAENGETDHHFSFVWRGRVSVRVGVRDVGNGQRGQGAGALSSAGDPSLTRRLDWSVSFSSI